MDPEKNASLLPLERRESHREEILAEQVRQLYAHAPIGVVATVTNSLIVFVILKNLIPDPILGGWLAAMMAITVLRLALVLRFRRVEFQSASPRAWGKRFLAGLTLSGIGWGTLGLFPFSQMTSAHEVFIAFVLGGMAAGAAATYSTMRGCYLAYSLPALSPLAVHFLLKEDVFHIAMGAMVFFYGVLLWRLSVQNYQVNRSSLLLRFENRGMITRLKGAMEDVEELNRKLRTEIEAKHKAEEELRASHAHLEKIVVERTADLLRTNEQLKREVEERKETETVLKETQEKLTQAKEAAEGANRAKSEFLANMSHEMRTPLAGALGMIQLVLQMDIAEQPRQLLEMAKRSTDSLLRLISDLLDFSRLEAGTMVFEKKSFPLAEVVRTAVEVVSIHAREKGLILSWSIEEGVPENVEGDEGRLRQVLVNLVGNSIKFTRHGEVGVSVRLVEKTGEQEGRFLLFSVRDTGIGIPPDQMERIFGKFTQVDSSWTRKHGGAGLGLALSREIVEKSGGRIWAESRVEEGSVFHFTYPLE